MVRQMRLTDISIRALKTPASGEATRLGRERADLCAGDEVKDRENGAVLGCRVAGLAARDSTVCGEPVIE